MKNKLSGSSKRRTLTEGIQKLSGTYGVAMVKLCDAIVKSVDLDNRICIVNSLEGGEFEGLKVRFMPEVCDGNMNIPSVDSTVIILFSTFSEPIVVSMSWLDRKQIVVGNQKWNIIDGKQTFNSDKYGGLATVKNSEITDGGLQTRYNKLESDLNDLKNKLASAFTSIVNEPGSGAPSAFQASLATILTGVPPATPMPLPTSYCGKKMVQTTEDMISNKNIVHGDKAVA